MKVYSDEDANPAALKEGKVAVIGYGSQGRAHALNLSNSGCDVVVGVRFGGAGDKRAREDGLETAPVREAVEAAGVVVLLTPDMSHESLFKDEIEPGLKPGDALSFAHGFSILYGRVKPANDIDVIMVAPKGPGDLVRREYERGRGVPCLFAVNMNAAAAFPVSSPCIRTRRAGRKSARFPMRVSSAARPRARSKRRSRKKQKPISSASRRCSAAAPRNWCSPGLKP